MPKTWDLFEHPVKTFKEFKGLVREYRSRQDRNIENNVSVSYVLDIQRRSTFSFLPSPLYDCIVEDPSPPAPTVLEIKRRPATTNLADLPVTSIKVTLTEPLYVGAPRHSQVWKAVTGDGATVVVKMFQVCFSNQPDWYPDMHVDFNPEEEMAHREAWAYSRLKNMQGLTIPHSYGFYDIKVPSGDVVCAHVMEYIEGMSLERFAIVMRHQENYESVRDKIMTRTIEFLFYIHQRGVLHRDFISCNIICPVNSPEDCVVIDFGFSMSSSDPVAIETKKEEIDIADIYPLFASIHSFVGAYAWIKNRAAEMRGNRPWIKFLLTIVGNSHLEEWQPISDSVYQNARMFDEERDESDAALKGREVESYFYTSRTDTSESNYYCGSSMPFAKDDDDDDDERSGRFTLVHNPSNIPTRDDDWMTSQEPENYNQKWDWPMKGYRRKRQQ